MTVLGCTEELFDELLAADRELGDAVLALIQDGAVEAHLPPRERRYLMRVLNAYLPVQEKIVALVRPVKTEPAQNFWKGFVMGLHHAGRKDLLSRYPAAEDAAALIEAECLVRRNPNPPPVN